jgi:hypothetical protein
VPTWVWKTISSLKSLSIWEKVCGRYILEDLTPQFHCVIFHGDPLKVWLWETKVDQFILIAGTHAYSILHHNKKKLLIFLSILPWNKLWTYENYCFGMKLTLRIFLLAVRVTQSAYCLVQFRLKSSSAHLTQPPIQLVTRVLSPGLITFLPTAGVKNVMPLVLISLHSSLCLIKCRDKFIFVLIHLHPADQCFI